jgi:hypothetical protein
VAILQHFSKQVSVQTSGANSQIFAQIQAKARVSTKFGWPAILLTA